MLRHETPDGGGHYDWMIERPDTGTSRPPLATWRVELPPWRWSAAAELELTPLPDHRRVYLDYEGPISGGRGRVHRVDRGEAAVRAWSSTAAELAVRMDHFQGALRLEALGPERWRAVVLP